MKFKSIERRGFVAVLGAFAIAGCTVTVPEPVPGQPPVIQPGPIQPPPPPPPAASIKLQNSFYNGRSGGKLIRAYVARSGSSLTVTSQTGRNFTENYSNNGGGNTYYSSSGYSVSVTSTRSFIWNGPFGRVTMND
jgi:hypothetical protein